MMNFEIAVFGVLPLMVVVLCGTALRLLTRRRISLVDCFALCTGALNGVGFLFVLWATQAGLNESLWQNWLGRSGTVAWLFPTLSIIAVMGVWFGETLGNTLYPRKKKSYSCCASLARNKKFLGRISWIFLLLGVITYWLYARPYGGFSGLLKYSALIRSGRFAEIGIDNPLSFLQRFGGLGMFSAFLFEGLLFEAHSVKEKFVNLMGLILASVFSFYVLYSWKGRLMLLVFLLTLLLGLLFWRKGFTLRSVLYGLFFSALLSIVGLPFVTLLIAPGKSSSSAVQLLAKELSFPAASFAAVVEAPEIRWMRDIAFWPIYFLPERLWKMGWGIDTASDYITLLIMGAPKGEAGVTGSIPADFVTFGYLQGGPFGLAIWAMLWGVMLCWLDRWLARLSLRGLQQVLYAFAVLSVAMMTVFYSDPEHIIECNLHFIIGCLVVAIVSRVSSRPWCLSGVHNG